MNKCENEDCEGHGEFCDYVIDGYATECCICGEYEPHQRCADQISDMIDNAYDNYKDQQLRNMI